MCKRQSGSGKRGFTLVEIIVVLVILAVLAGMLIPALTGWIDKAQEGQAIREARSCVSAAQTIAVELYAARKVYRLEEQEAETLALAETPAGGDIQAIHFDDSATLTRMVYLASNGLVVTYENGGFSVSKTAGSTLSDSTAMSKIYGVMQQEIGTPNKKYYYSGTSDSVPVANALKAEGIDLDALAANWSIRYNPNNEYPKLYWTDADLSGHSAGDIIPVMAYTLTTGRYTVWNVRLVNVGGALRLGTEANMVTTVDSPAQSYEQMQKDYQAAVTQ